MASHESIKSKPIMENTDSLVEDCESFIKNYKGDSYFSDVAHFLANRTGIDYILIGHLTNEDNDVKTVALLAYGKVAEEMVYPLNGTPCENVVGRNCCYYPDGIQQMFPKDKELRDLNIHSYIGSPLFDENEKPLGIIALMHSSMIPNAAKIEKALEAIISRTEAELINYLRSR